MKDWNMTVGAVLMHLQFMWVLVYVQTGC